MLFDAGGEGESGDLGEGGEIIVTEPEEGFYKVIWEGVVVEDFSDGFCGEVDGFYGLIDDAGDLLAAEGDANDGAGF